MQDQRQTWKKLAADVDAEQLTGEHVRFMTPQTHAVLALVAARGAAKGRALALDPVGISWTEDEDTALDAVQRVYSEVIQGREHRSIVGRAYWAGRQFGKRRAKDRIRETSSAIVPEPTDKNLPGDDKQRTWAELLASCHPSKRQALNEAATRWLGKGKKDRNEIRTIRNALGVTSKPGAPALAN